MSISNTEILNIIDKAFPYMPEGKGFLFVEVLKSADIKEIDLEDKEAVRTVKRYFVEKLLYARYDAGSFDYIHLNGIGPIVKKAGGHFAYLEQKEKRRLAEQRLKEMEFEKFTADYESSIFQATKGNELQQRSFTRSGWAIGISIAAVIISIATIVVTHYDTKPDPFPYDTTAANVRLQELEQRLQAIEHKTKAIEPFKITPDHTIQHDTMRKHNNAR